MKSIYKIAFMAALPMAIVSCGGEKSGEEPVNMDSTQVALDTTPVTVDDNVKFKFDFAVANIPSPVQVIHDLSAFKIAYNAAMLNDINKMNTYTDDFKKSINLGIYNLDMSYAIAYDQGNDVMKYLKTSMQEAEALGLKAAFDEMLGQRAENNISNKDSLMRMIDEIYVKGDSYLRTNERVQTATHVFVGSWIEALYIMSAVDAVEKDPSQKENIHKHLWEQRFYLKNIIDLLDSFKDSKDDKMLMNELKLIHDEISTVNDPKELDEKKFKSIADKVIALRNKLTK